MTTIATLHTAHPRAFALDPADLDGLESYLRARLWITPWASVQRAERAGDGNMNLTLRVETTTGSLIVKQGRPWVEKYPTIAAPWGRIAVEGACYEIARRLPATAQGTPALIGVDEESQILAVEDLGPAADFAGVYQGGAIASQEVESLAAWLAAFHDAPVPPAHRQRLGNHAMRALNHEYIFHQPLRSGAEAGLDAVCPGLAALAGAMRRDTRLVEEMAGLGRRYLSDGDGLAHGDFFPGSWLRAPDGPRVIDFEFAFLGEVEFDLGVMVAHLHLAHQPSLVALALDTYGARRGFERPLVARYAGAEILRRVLGVAQLPLLSGLDHRRAALELARALVCGERDVAA
ncbi:MAG: phosphotransferase [Vicinamibacterales bacterium]|nr:phosphotransferase [Vicinamibacterales bacterium]